jgi:hypothetical protein
MPPSPWLKMAITGVGVYLGGVAAAYQLDPCPASWLKWVMGGAAPLAGYLIGFWQINTAIRPPISYAGVPPRGGA